MTSVNQLQNTVQTFINQLNSHEQSQKTGQVGANAAHSSQIPTWLMQDLRNDVKAVLDGTNPDKSVANLLKSLQTLQTYIGRESSRSDGAAKEWPAGKELPSGGVEIIKGKDGQPIVVGPAKQWTGDATMPGEVKLTDEAAMRGVKEWPADKELPSGGVEIIKGKDGQPIVVGPVKQWTGDGEMPGAVSLKGLQSKTSKSLDDKADTVASTLKKLLDGGATGADARRVLADLRSAIQDLVGVGATASDAEQVRKALVNSLQSQA
ncbi:hypothetical protein [Pseudomonas sp. CBZ-4]|uniref:hypothetical protein n=1 Tax=Pseudomonas sp. CBZ-4 TaxID=1163065 RepID=UPI00036816B0|nr:hypothetical protein [Pseudomonas sp. CBZ-4]